MSTHDHTRGDESRSGNFFFDIFKVSFGDVKKAQRWPGNE
jgi:hypothetical protein